MLIDEIELEDRNHKAIVWALKQPNLKQMCFDMYVTKDTLNDAIRFEKSKEFKECLRLIKNNLKSRKKPLKLLDLGAGNGVASWAFAKNGFEVVATDLCMSNICGLDAAKRLQDYEGVSFEIVRGDGHDLGFDNEEFDVVFCRQVLHHADDLEKFLKQIGRIMKKGGVFIATREQVAENSKQLDQLFKVHPLHHITQDEKAYKNSEYLKAMKGAKIETIAVYGIYDSVINYSPLGEKEINRQIRAAFGPIKYSISRTSSSLKSKLRKKLSDAYQKENYSLNTYIGLKK